MPGPLWFSPLCDIILHKVAYWHAFYHRGEVAATCKFNDPMKGVIDKPTKYAHKIIWTEREFDTLLRLLDEHCSNKALVAELRQVRTLLPKGRLVQGPGNPRSIIMSFYFEHVDEIRTALLEARDGKTKTIQEYVEEGKDLFE